MAQIPFGKLLGGSLGMLVGGPWGSAVGVAMGHRFDKGYKEGDVSTAQIDVQTIHVLFHELGHFAVLGGRVSDSDVKNVYLIIKKLKLSASEKKQAISSFNQGRELKKVYVIREGHDHIGILVWAFGELMQGRDLMVMQAMQLLKMLNESKMAVNGSAFGFSPGEDFESFKSLLFQTKVQQPFELLAVRVHSDLSVCRKARKRQLQKYHPDRLPGNISPELLQLAEQKVVNVNDSYELIRLWKKMADE